MEKTAKAFGFVRSVKKRADIKSYRYASPLYVLKDGLRGTLTVAHVLYRVLTEKKIQLVQA